MRDFDLQFNRQRKFMNVVFVAIFLLSMTIVLSICIGYGYIGYKAIQAGPEGIGQELGKVLKGFEEGSK